MRLRVAALGILGWMAVPCLARRAVTVEQLQQMLAGAAAQHRSDEALAVQVYDVEMHARLDDATLAQLMAASPGPETKRGAMIAEIGRYVREAVLLG